MSDEPTDIDHPTHDDYREASATLGMQHADFLRVAVELELFDR